MMTNCDESLTKLSIAILVVGTRGDVQPFMAVARRLQEFGHCVRLATHSHYHELVESAGLNFYPLGGDPRIIVQGFMRTENMLFITRQEIATQAKQLKAVMESLIPACTQPDPKTGEPFRAQAIIANPPTYGRVDVAEALAVPLHIFFTVPWTPTSAFPHPFLTKISQRAGFWLSYAVIDLLIWWGLRGCINNLREKKLNLSPINGLFNTSHVSISNLPTTYMWSPHLLPKPNDWGPLVDVVGYSFVDLGSKYEPPQELVQWIQKGPAPIYIGFGSMPLEDSGSTTSIVLEALKNTGQRGILDQGWGGLATNADITEDVFLISDCPHDWLFPQCYAVIHHGGAGTTAAGLKAGCPTTIVPFCGDQFLWGRIVHEKGIGPAPVPVSQLSVESLSKAITFMLQPQVKSRAVELGGCIENEDGAAAAVDSFHRHLPSELPMTVSSSEKENGSVDFVQSFFGYVGRLCCLFCVSSNGYV